MGLFGKTTRAPNSNPENIRQARSVSDAEIRYLEVLRREIANLLMESDPELMIRCYHRAWSFEREVAESSQRARAEEAALLAKFPRFDEFDLIATRHFVPYQEARNMWSDEDLVERYQEVSRMLVLMRRHLDLPGSRPVHDVREEKVLLDNLRRVKDRKFRERIEGVIGRFYAFRAGLEKGGQATFGVSYEDAEVEIFHLPTVSDNEYGIIFKATQEFGVYGFCVFDSGEISYSYYRSDATFNERKSLMK